MAQTLWGSPAPSASPTPPLFPEIQSGGIGGGTTGLVSGATTYGKPADTDGASPPTADWYTDANGEIWDKVSGQYVGNAAQFEEFNRLNPPGHQWQKRAIQALVLGGAAGAAYGVAGAGAGAVGAGEALPAGAGGAFDMGGLAGGVPGAGGATGFTTGIDGTYGFAGIGGLGLGAATAANAAGSGGVYTQSTGPGVTPGINGYNWQQLLGAGMTLKDILQLASQGYGLYSSIGALGNRRDAERELRAAFERSDPFAKERAAAGNQYSEWLQDPNKYMSSPIARLQIDELNRAARAKQSQLGTTWSVNPEGNITGSGSGAADFAKQLQTNLASQYETALGNRAQQAGMSLFPSADMARNLAGIQGSEAGLRRDVATDVFKIGGTFADLYDKYFGA